MYINSSKLESKYGKKKQYIAEKRMIMYLDKEMPEAADYKTVVEFIRWALAEQGLNPKAWAEAQEDGLVSPAALYNILNYTSEGKYKLVYEIATRLGAEININLPYPSKAKK